MKNGPRKYNGLFNYIISPQYCTFSTNKVEKINSHDNMHFLCPVYKALPCLANGIYWISRHLVAMGTNSKICLPLMKAFWELGIFFANTNFDLFERTLAMIFTHHPLGLKAWSPWCQLLAKTEAVSKHWVYWCNIFSLVDKCYKLFLSENNTSLFCFGYGSTMMSAVMGVGKFCLLQKLVRH